MHFNSENFFILIKVIDARCFCGKDRHFSTATSSESWMTTEMAEFLPPIVRRCFVLALAGTVVVCPAAFIGCVSFSEKKDKVRQKPNMSKKRQMNIWEGYARGGKKNNEHLAFGNSFQCSASFAFVLQQTIKKGIGK